MKPRNTSLLLLLALLTLFHPMRAASAAPDDVPGAVQASRLSCEYLESPLGIDEERPRLSWRLASTQRGQKQTAYRLLVASSRDQLEGNLGDLWDSGRVESDRSMNVEYAGAPLESGRLYFWKVMVWGADGKAPEWSETGSWGMIRSHWRRKGDELTMEVSVPVNTTNTTATIHVPGTNITEGGRTATEAPGVTLLREEGVSVFRVESGEYCFTSRGLK